MTLFPIALMKTRTRSINKVLRVLVSSRLNLFKLQLRISSQILTEVAIISAAKIN